VSNLTIIKSLSKVLGVPGLRLGFVYSYNRAFNDFIRKNIPIWNCNSVAENFLEIILKHRESLARSFQNTIKDREDFAADLRTQEAIDEVFASAGNFLLVRFKGSAHALKDLPQQILAAASIYVKDVSEKLDDGGFYLRLAVRLPEENKRLIGVLREIL
jgi:histidinol-phosphate/aromatic aminotransferase/cobyric acid decarboxylase-like protein